MPTAQSGPKRVMFVIGSLAVGGAERHVVSVAAGLRTRGWQTSVFALSPQGPLLQQLADAEVLIKGPALPGSVERLLGRRFSAWTRLILAFFLLAIHMVRYRGTVVHFFLPAAYIVGGLAAWVTGARPRLMSRRSLNRYQLKNLLYGKIERWLHPRMDRLVGNSSAVVRELEIESRGETPVRLIYNGIDKAALPDAGGRAVVRKILGIQETELVIAIVANLIPYKGHADLLKALAYVNRQLPGGWHLLCTGRDDGILNELRDLAESLGITKNVHWLGPRLDVHSILSAADIAVSSSHEEGFSNAILEAMLACLPMVVTNVGGNAEAVLNGVTGYVVPPHDPEALGEAILYLADNPGRIEMGVRGQVRVLEKFSAESCLNGYEALYKELI